MDWLPSQNLQFLNSLRQHHFTGPRADLEIRIGGVFSWDNKLAGAQLLPSRVRIFLDFGYPHEEMLSTFQRHVENIMCSYSPVFQTFNRTKGRLIKLNRGRPRPLQQMEKAAFMATKYNESLEDKMPPGWHCRSKFYSNEALWNLARSQIDYILSKTPYSMSYLVGFVIISHRGSSIPKNTVKYGCKGRKWRDSPDS